VHQAPILYTRASYNSAATQPHGQPGILHPAVAPTKNGTSPQQHHPSTAPPISRAPPASQPLAGSRFRIHNATSEYNEVDHLRGTNSVPTNLDHSSEFSRFPLEDHLNQPTGSNSLDVTSIEQPSGSTGGSTPTHSTLMLAPRKIGRFEVRDDSVNDVDMNPVQPVVSLQQPPRQAPAQNSSKVSSVSGPPFITKLPVSEWTIDNVVEWLGTLGDAFLPYQKTFSDNGINGEMLTNIDLSELEELEVTKKVHRRRIIQGVKKLNPEYDEQKKADR